MDYKKCSIYGMKSRKRLFEVLNIEDKDFMKQDFVVSKVNPFLVSGKRLAEAPNAQLKEYQRRLLRKLQQLEFPENIFSGIKRKSYIDNARYHKDKDRLFKIDISKFFPSITRDKVYKFFREKMSMSQDVSEVITNLTTIDLDRKPQTEKKMPQVNKFIEEKGIKIRNHLATGSPPSPLLSYLVNIDMFDELQKFADKNNLIMTVYADDVAFSSNTKISGNMQKSVLNIVKKHHYISNKQKSKFYDRGTNKRITGGIISKNKTIEPQNKLLEKLQMKIEQIKDSPENILDRDVKETRGLLSAIQMTDKKMPNLENKIRELEKQNKKAD